MGIPEILQKILQYFTQKSVWAAWELNIQTVWRKILKIATGLGVK
jgi:hypothetical protein